LDGGAWFDVVSTSPASGASFASNGYNATIKNGTRSDFVEKAVWSASSGGFIETVVNFTDTAKYAGKVLRIRWSLATDASQASSGWYIDTVSLVGGGDIGNQSPVITTPARSAATETITDPDETVFGVVRGRSITLSVAATDDGGEAALTYTWSVSGGAGVQAGFDSNGTNAAKNTVVHFEAAGDYVFTVTIRDAQASTITSAPVNIRVVPTADNLAVDPAR
jgi:hypothetical protein